MAVKTKPSGNDKEIMYNTKEKHKNWSGSSRKLTQIKTISKNKSRENIRESLEPEEIDGSYRVGVATEKLCKTAGIAHVQN